MTKREVLEKLEELGFGVKKISQLTGIPDARIYKWYKGKGLPKLEDFNKLKDLYKRMKPNPTNDFMGVEKDPKVIYELLDSYKETIRLQKKRIAELEAKARAPVVKTKTGG